MLKYLMLLKLPLERSADIKLKPKEFWKYTSTRLKTREQVENLMDESGSVTSDKQETAEVLSRYFSSVFTVEEEENPPVMSCEHQGPILDDIDVSPDKVRARLLSQ